MLCWGGVAVSLLLIAGVIPAAAAAALWVIYLSLTIAGQTFLEFQWDSLLLEAGVFHDRFGDAARAEEYLSRAIALAPGIPQAYESLGNHFLRVVRFREAHRTALEGLARAGPTRELWRIVSETYVARGDLAAAVRARRVALRMDPSSVADQQRLEELLEASTPQQIPAASL